MLLFSISKCFCLLLVCGSVVSEWNWNVSSAASSYMGEHIIELVDCMQLICMRPKWICLTFFDVRFLSINWDANRIKYELNLTECSLSRSNSFNGLNCEIVKAFTCQSHFECKNYLILNLLRLPAQRMLVDSCRCLGWIIQCSVFTVHLENTNHPEKKTSIGKRF